MQRKQSHYWVEIVSLIAALTLLIGTPWPDVWQQYTHHPDGTHTGP